MRLHHVCLTGLLCVLGACGGEGARDAKSAEPAAAQQMTYAACMAVANREASQAETVARTRECLRLPDAPPADSTLPSGVSPPPGTAAADSGEIRSLYTELPSERCRVTRTDEETGGTTMRCPGFAGYALNVHDDDARMSIDVVTPDGREHPLNYWGVITHGFSALGPRAEWRMRGNRPIALIVRVNASEDPEDSSRITSYLAVAKITAGETCVTDRIPPAANANELARRAADASAGRPCAPDV